MRSTENARKKSFDGVGADGRGKIIEKTRKNKFLRLAEIGEDGKIFFLRHYGRNVKTSVGSESLKDALCGISLKTFSCAYKFHFKSPFYFEKRNSTTSPSCISYALPSGLNAPAARAPDVPLYFT